VKFFGRVGRGPKNDRLDFGGDAGHSIFKGLFTVVIPMDNQE